MMKEKNCSEVHLFVIWEQGRYAEQEVISRIASSFEVIQTFSITWSPYLVNRNYTRFYDTKLPDNSQKEKYAGTGEFKLIVVRDNRPHYDYRKTNSGEAFVNTNMFDCKAELRELTGGGHKIHATNDIEETKHDIVMLLGQSIDDFLKKYYFPEKQLADIRIQRDLSGAIGWASLDELFYVLNECLDYVILRNSDNISADYYRDNAGDIDLLVSDRTRCQFILGDLSCLASEVKKDSIVSINNEKIAFELYQSRENLFESRYEVYLFSSKILKRGYYCLPVDIEYITLIYHACLFHDVISDKHIARLDKYKEIKDLRSKENIKNALLQELFTYFDRLNFKITPPDDSRIFFDSNLIPAALYVKNYKRAGYFSLLFKKIIWIRKFKSYTKICVFSFLVDIWEIKFSIRYKFLKKELRFSIGGRSSYG